MPRHRARHAPITSLPLRGLLAGLLALITFASGAVAMTAGSAGPAAPTPATAQATQTTRLAAGRDRDGDDGGLREVRGAGGR